MAEVEARGQRGADTLIVKSWMTIESDEKTFRLSAKRELSVNDTVKYSKSWKDAIPRDLV